MNDSSESSIEYADIAYESYEYPARYRKRIQSGRRFVYYRGRRKPGGGRQPQVYLGAGIIGDISESITPGRLVCQILDPEEFLVPLPFKDEHGVHLEPGGSRSGYFQQGVREISEEDFQRILALAGAGPMDGVPQRVIEESSQLLVPGGSSPGYATAAVARETERQSRNAVVRFLGAALPGAKIIEMATNNPGFDLETSVDRVRFVEVKGTSKPLPTFFLSEGERRFGTSTPTRIYSRSFTEWICRGKPSTTSRSRERHSGRATCSLRRNGPGDFPPLHTPIRPHGCWAHLGSTRRRDHPATARRCPRLCGRRCSLPCSRRRRRRIVVRLDTRHITMDT